MALTGGESGHLGDHEDAVLTVSHGADATVARPTLGSAGTAAAQVVWVGTVEPDNAVADDELLRTDQNLRYRYDGTNFVAVPAAHSGALVRLDANEAIPHSAVTAIPWDSEVYDDNEFWDAAAPTDLVVPSGVSRVRLVCGVLWASNSTGKRLVVARKNGAQFPGNPALEVGALGNSQATVASATVPVAAGDVFTMLVFQGSGGSLDLLAVDGRTFFAIEAVS